jgi:hypothetical protein
MLQNARYLSMGQVLPRSKSIWIFHSSAQNIGKLRINIANTLEHIVGKLVFRGYLIEYYIYRASW